MDTNIVSPVQQYPPAGEALDHSQITQVIKPWPGQNGGRDGSLSGWPQIERRSRKKMCKASGKI